MELISQITQMNSVGAAEPICAICEISEICVCFWNSRDARPLYRDDSRLQMSAFRLHVSAAKLDLLQRLEVRDEVRALPRRQH